MSYDKKCYELAKIFLSDAGCQEEARIEQLAQDIQTCIEDYIEFDLKLGNNAEPIKEYNEDDPRLSER